MVNIAKQKKFKGVLASLTAVQHNKNTCSILPLVYVVNMINDFLQKRLICYSENLIWYMRDNNSIIISVESKHK